MIPKQPHTYLYIYIYLFSNLSVDRNMVKMTLSDSTSQKESAESNLVSICDDHRISQSDRTGHVVFMGIHLRFDR